MTNVERLAEALWPIMQDWADSTIGTDEAVARLVAQGVGFEDEHVQAFAEWLEREGGNPFTDDLVDRYLAHTVKESPTE